MRKFLLVAYLMICMFGNAQTWNSIDFDIIAETCSSTSGEIFISEVYDCQGGNYGVIEFYNPIDNPVILTGVYEIKKYHLPGSTVTSTPLVGTIPAHSTFLFVVADSSGSSGSCLCPGLGANQTTNNSSMGFNAQDEFELLKNGNVIDNLIESNNVVGYTYRRNPNAIAPKVTYAAADWTYINQNNNTTGCSDLGTHYNPISIVDVERWDDPPTYSICSLPARIRIPVTGGSGQYERRINGGPFVNHTNPWILTPDLTAAMVYTVIIRDKLNPGCSVTLTFEVDELIVGTSPILPL